MPILNEQGQLVANIIGYCRDCRRLYLVPPEGALKCPLHQDELLPVEDMQEWMKEYIAASILCEHCGCLMPDIMRQRESCWTCASIEIHPMEELFASWPPAVH